MPANPVILSIDTSGEELGVDISVGGVSNARRIIREPRIHAARLAPTINEVLEASGIGYEDLRCVAVAKGPGSYTGLRIGVSCAKALAYSLDIALVGVPTLEAMSLAHGSDGNDVCLATSLTSRRGEIYLQLWDGSDPPRSLTDAQSVSLSEAGDVLAGSGRRRFIFLGSGARELHRSILERQPDLDMAVEDILRQPVVHGVWMLGLERYQAGVTEDIASFEPLYLKDFVAKMPHSSGKVGRR